MFAEMKAAYLVHKLAQRDPRAMPGDLVIQLAYAHNARLAQVFWPDLRLGELSEGAAADLVFLDYRPTTPLSAGNLALAPALWPGGVGDNRHRLRRAGADARPPPADPRRGGDHRPLAGAGRAGLETDLAAATVIDRWPDFARRLTLSGLAGLIANAALAALAAWLIVGGLVRAPLPHPLVTLLATVGLGRLVAGRDTDNGPGHSPPGRRGGPTTRHSSWA